VKAIHKHQRDRQRLAALLYRDPLAPGRMLAGSYCADGQRRGRSIRQAAERMDRRKSGTGTVLVRALVGHGLLRPAGPDGYTLTRRGRAAVRDFEARIGRVHEPAIGLPGDTAGEGEA
jgi:hypothetical protein